MLAQEGSLPLRNIRLDILLVERGLVQSRSRAADAIRRGAVHVDGESVLKPGQQVGSDAVIDLRDPASAYVSRAALKLAHALDHFSVDPARAICLDIGASTGGFTQLLLERGAERVHAVDVGHDQLAAVLRGDARVIVHEGLNARDLGLAHIGETVDLIVADVSFISLKLALPPALRLARPGAGLIALVKPQFEVGRDGLNKSGIVRNAALAQQALEDVAAWLGTQSGWQVVGSIESPIAGGDGNREFLIYARFSGPGTDS